MDLKVGQVTEEMVSRFHELNQLSKAIDAELSELKTKFNAHFDSVLGQSEKGEIRYGNYKLQRQIRKSESFHNNKTVQKLEELNLQDCIITTKQPDKQKIEAALTLGLIPYGELDECVQRKITPVIVVKETPTVK
ncbi:hypothetical protein QUF84_05295 [Fictibacillus enclensis]|uniref:hypothetical protein n=1 Tax=Fictibacillus enclensis TaxID=1017270 RepID=UPI0024BF3132|nr:hypothetical protein [Fictibacillus enclensis]MDM5336645.1 hypothetical protein [Fictibacillus enclensis]WHY73077.1 hypothetical protein QNH15_03845 [Fictibacillus enclensis]